MKNIWRILGWLALSLNIVYVNVFQYSMSKLNNSSNVMCSMWLKPVHGGRLNSSSEPVVNKINLSAAKPYFRIWCRKFQISNLFCPYRCIYQSIPSIHPSLHTVMWQHAIMHALHLLPSCSLFAYFKCLMKLSNSYFCIVFMFVSLCQVTVASCECKSCKTVHSLMSTRDDVQLFASQLNIQTQFYFWTFLFHNSFCRQLIFASISVRS